MDDAFLCLCSKDSLRNKNFNMADCRLNNRRVFVIHIFAALREISALDQYFKFAIRTLVYTRVSACITASDPS